MAESRPTGSARTIVVGGGVMGLATAWELTRRGERPIVVERFARGHTEGASHGVLRNYNNAYGETHYLDLLDRARTGWDALGAPDGEPLLRLHGLISHGAGFELTVGGGDLPAIHDRLRARGIPADLLGAPEAARRWPGMRFEGTVLHSADAGVARAAATLLELERRIVAGGGEVRWQTPVDAIDEDADGVTVRLVDGATLRADAVVVTAGAWTDRLVPGIRLPRLVVTEESPAHFAPTDATHVWPSFNHFLAPGRYPGAVYGMPTPGEGIKVGFHRVGDVVDPDERPYAPTHVAALREYVSEWFPGLDPDSAVHITCTYTSTDDGTFVLDRRGRLIIGAGFSGHGFKFAPGIGAVLADLALDADARAAEPFRLPA